MLLNKSVQVFNSVRKQMLCVVLSFSCLLSWIEIQTHVESELKLSTNQSFHHFQRIVLTRKLRVTVHFIVHTILTTPVLCCTTPNANLKSMF